MLTSTSFKSLDLRFQSGAYDLSAMAKKRLLGLFDVFYQPVVKGHCLGLNH